MKRRLCLILTLCLLLGIFSLCANAYSYDKELEAVEGSVFVKNELLVGTAEKLDMTAFEGEAPFDFFGVSIIEIEDMRNGSASSSDKGFYHIKLAPETDSIAASEQLSETEGVEEVFFNYIEYLDYRDRHYPENSPYISKTPEELEDIHLFAPDEMNIYLDYELDLTEFEGEGKHYLFGVCVDSISAIESEGSAYGYAIKLGEQTMHNSDAIWVFECNDDVVSVDYKSDYGNGDINADGEVDPYDYILAKRMYFKTYLPYDEELGYADVNRDGNVDEYDYILIKRIHFGTYVIE